MQRSFVGLAIFVLLAVGLSGLFRVGPFDFYNAPNWSWVATFATASVAISLGPTLAALFSWRVFGRQNRQSSLFGTWPLGATTAAITPTAGLAILGIPNDLGWEPHLLGAFVGCFTFVYALGEEIGWRGYLADAMRPAPFALRVACVTVVWWGWHLWFLDDTFTIQHGLITGIALLGGSTILSLLTNETKSLMLAASFHSLGNLAYLTGLLSCVPKNTRLTVAATSFVILLALHAMWKKRFPNVPTTELAR